MKEALQANNPTDISNLIGKIKHYANETSIIENDMVKIKVNTKFSKCELKTEIPENQPDNSVNELKDKFPFVKLSSKNKIERT